MNPSCKYMIQSINAYCQELNDKIRVQEEYTNSLLCCLDIMKCKALIAAFSLFFVCEGGIITSGLYFHSMVLII